MRIIALVDRNVCELAHISFCFCADAFLRRANERATLVRGSPAVHDHVGTGQLGP